MRIPILSIIATAAAIVVAVARGSVDCRDSEEAYERFMNCYNDRAVRCQPDADKSGCFLENRGECDGIVWGDGFKLLAFSSFEGNGSGFKFEGVTDAGFINNRQPGNFTFTRNTAWSNAQVGCHTVVSTSRLIGNIASVNAESTENAN
ncbi:hypothetical protein DL766_005288 [Monosporascus sp. MC13-8B]|uniref:Uncharacterized protein n=1 Tax=Monosporascus cannonballus TaxID=155416 RepID=A0ABY0GS42_9PEZI|nr:hypothetical protein DL762_010026 [Monosporascus cannonballus]RYO76789.1 hypothetical protein DL763_010176 [Monosporascus cannonballus]RYP29555.1 hypothetical protein DL766_005288 [Monosporascus sp. MC13-8B]